MSSAVIDQFRIGPGSVTNSGLTSIGSIALTDATSGLFANQIALCEFAVLALNEVSPGIYSEQWRVNVALQLLAGPTYRLGTVSKSSLNNSQAPYSVLDGSTPLDVQISGGNLVLLAKAGSTFGTARVWAVTRICRAP